MVNRKALVSSAPNFDYNTNSSMNFSFTWAWSSGAPARFHFFCPREDFFPVGAKSYVRGWIKRVAIADHSLQLNAGLFYLLSDIICFWRLLLGSPELPDLSDQHDQPHRLHHLQRGPGWDGQELHGWAKLKKYEVRKTSLKRNVKLWEQVGAELYQTKIKLCSSFLKIGENSPKDTF